jgi:hypothetical protein
MAVIIPFADANAHGSICDTVSFRRHRGKVVFQKKPKPKQPNTQAQKDQKQWWKDTWQLWRQLSGPQLAWLQAKAGPADTTPANYYFDKIKDDHGPNGQKNSLIKDILEVDIPVPFCPGVDDLAFGLFLLVPGGNFGLIQDNENIFAPQGPQPAHDEMGLSYSNNAGAERTMPDDYEWIITYKTYDDVQHQDSLYFPEIVMPDEAAVDLFFDTSMSIYSDRALTNLMKANYWPHPWPPA